MSDTSFGDLSFQSLATSFNLGGKRTLDYMDRRASLLSRLLWDLQRRGVVLWDQLHNLTHYESKGTIRGLLDPSVRGQFRAEPNIPEDISRNIEMIKALGINDYVTLQLEATESSVQPTNPFLLRERSGLRPSTLAKRLQCFGDQTSDYITLIIAEINLTIEAIEHAKSAVGMMGIDNQMLGKLKERAREISKRLAELGIPAIPLGLPLEGEEPDDEKHTNLEGNVAHWPLDYLDYWVQKKYEILLNLPSFKDISLASLNEYDEAVGVRVNDIAYPEGTITNRAVAESFGAILLFETDQIISNEPKRPPEEYNKTSSDICEKVRDTRPTSLKQLTALTREGALDAAIWEHALTLGKKVYADKETIMQHKISKTKMERALGYN